MRITKYEHACLDIQQDNTRIVIDPGEFTKSLIDLDNIDAVVITHIHGDHFNQSLINQIITKNPNLKIWTTSEVTKSLEDKAMVIVTGKHAKGFSVKLSFSQKGDVSVHNW